MMKKCTYYVGLFVMSILLFSCKKTEIDLPAAQNKEAALLSKSNNASISNRETDDPPPVATCPPTVVTLFAGQTINAGNVTVSNNANFITVTYNAQNDYVITQTHLFVGECNLIPVTNNGNPKVGHFPYKTTHINVTSYTYQIPVSVIPKNGCVCIAAHAVLVKYNSAGQIIDQQTGWGNGTLINNSGNWATKFEFCACY